MKKEKIILRRNKDDDEFHYQHEDLIELRNLLHDLLPYEYSISELDDLINIIFERGIIE